MNLTGLHILLTYQCTFECDHCFAWGSPRQRGVLGLAQVQEALQQARGLGTVTSVYFEGGEPFLYYPTLLAGVRAAHALGFEVGIVTNGYWATSEADALEALRPFTGLLGDLTVSSDLFHYSERISRQAQLAQAAAGALGIPVGVITIDKPDRLLEGEGVGQIPEGDSGVMYRGRAVEKLAPAAPAQPWVSFTRCPHEDLREPGRVHLDPFGNLHLCQGIVLGNLFETPLAVICARYDPDAHPIAGPLLTGGPAGLAQYYGTPHAGGYADACHLCYETRRSLRSRFPGILAPNAMYGVY